jgi:hypothetical protein
MHQAGSYIKYSDNRSANFGDEIIIGDRPTIGKIINNNFNISSTVPPNKNENEVKKNLPSVLFNYSLVAFNFIVLIMVFGKIVATSAISFNSISTSIFVGSYFSLFLFTIFIISKRKMLTLKVKGETLLLKSFPALNEKIPINQILKCELNTIKNGKYNPQNKIHFALNENGNKYKQPVNSGITLQLINGQHIFIASLKS